MIDRASIGITPEIARNPDFDNLTKAQKNGADSLDFEKLMMESNGLQQAEYDKQKAASGGGELKIGETKSDKEFRDSLEKITGKKQDRLKNKLDKDDYLNLMVTQMKFQDPTKPMENQEMASQMAQFNSVEQLLGINKLLTQLNESQNAMRSDKLTQYLGMNVEVQGSNLKLNPQGKTNDAFVELPTAAGTVAVSIKDSNGVVVKTLQLGTLEAGKHKLDWDGTGDKGEKLPSGVYSFTVDAATVEGKPITTRSSIAAKVEAITNIADGGKFDTTAGIIDTKNVISVRAPDTAQAEMAKKPADNPVAASAPVGNAQASNAPVATGPVGNRKPEQSVAASPTQNAQEIASPLPQTKAPETAEKSGKNPHQPSARANEKHGATEKTTPPPHANKNAVKNTRGSGEKIGEQNVKTA